jgi:hypothetical protein
MPQPSKERSIWGLMAKTPKERFGTRLVGWLGIFAATTIIFPAAYRLAGEGL